MIAPSPSEVSRASACCGSRERAVRDGLAHLLAFCRLAGRSGEAILSAADLGRLARVSRRAAQSAMDRARDCGLVHGRWRYCQRTGYRLATAWRLVRPGAALVLAIAKRRRDRERARAYRASVRRLSASSAQETVSPSEHVKGRGFQGVKPAGQAVAEACRLAWDGLLHAAEGSAAWRLHAEKLVALGQAASPDDLRGF